MIVYGEYVCWAVQADGDEFVALAKQLNDSWSFAAKESTLNEDLVRQFAYSAAGSLCPMQAVIGGITAQEIMKVNIVSVKALYS
jgi:hypothetical protein